MSSSAATDGGAGLARDPRRIPAVLLVAGVLAVLLIVGGVLALLGQGSTSGPPPPNALVGARLIPLPAMSTVSGGPAGTAPWRHDRGAVLLFFAKWCTVCRTEVPTLAHALGHGDVGGVQVVGLEGDASLGTAKAFSSAMHVRFPVAWDKGLEVADALAPSGFPAAVFVKPSGRVVAVDYGALSIMQLSAGLSEIVHR